MALTDHMKPCTIIRRKGGTKRDKYNNKVRDSQEVASKVFIQPAGRGVELEPAAHDQASDTDWVGVFPIDAQLDSADGVRQGEEEYEVVGNPWRAEIGEPRMHHVEAFLRQVKGAEE